MQLVYFRTSENIHRLPLKKSLSYKINQVSTIRNRTLGPTEPFNNPGKCFEDGKSESPRTSQRWKLPMQPRKWFAMRLSYQFLPISRTYALTTWHCCVFPNKSVHLRDIFMKPSLSFFPTGQANFVPVQLQPEICSASSADPPRCFPALSPNVNGMQMNSTCKWTAQWTVTKRSCYSSSVTQQGSLTTYVLPFI